MMIMKNIWRIICFILLGLVVSISGSFAKSIFGMTAFLIIFVVLRMLLIYIFRAVYQKDRIDKQSERKKVPLKIIIPLSAFAGISLNLMFAGIIGILTPVAYDAAYYTDKTALSGIFLVEYIVVGLVWGCLLTPLTEELLFRGVVFSRLCRITRLTYAVAIQAVLFGVLHILTQGSFMQGIYTGSLGIITVLFYLWTGSIWSSIIIHMFFNSTTIIIDLIIGFHNLPKDSFFILISIGFAVLIFTSAFVFRCYKRLRANEFFSIF